MATAYSLRQPGEARFSTLTALMVPLAALFLQAFLPVARLSFFTVFDLPLLVTIYFAAARRNPVAGLLTGGIIGLAQDALTHLPIGVYGIAKTVIGYIASSLSARIDVDSPGSRFLLTFGFYLLHQVIFFGVLRGLIGMDLAWQWGQRLGSALANALLAVALFAALDRLRKQAE